MAAVKSESDGRVKRIRALAIQLEEQTVLNTVRSRARCREVAREIIDLVEAEDDFERRAPRVKRPDGDLLLLARITKSLVACQRADTESAA
jgi:hypothetical protein